MLLLDPREVQRAPHLLRIDGDADEAQEAHARRSVANALRRRICYSALGDGVRGDARAERGSGK